jgi:hypothetical protein
MITTEQGEQIAKLWSEMWDLYMEKCPGEVNDKDELKYTKEKCEPTKTATLN